MQIRLEELPRPASLPESYVMVAMYGGTSTFPLGCFYVLLPWWELFAHDPEVTVVPLADKGVAIVDLAPER